VIEIIDVMPPSVLVVDDDPGFLALATRLLSGVGIEVIWTAPDAAAAIVAAKDLQPEAALVDVGLPDENGINLARKLAALPWRPLVVLTSSDRDAAAWIESSGSERELTFVAKDELPSARLRELLGAP
jgi:CheY-like chemotaxis protein